MPHTRQVVDTNVLVRFLTGDPPLMAEKARKLVDQADLGKTTLVILPVIVAEAFYTLESYYEIERKSVADRLAIFLQCRGIQCVEKDRILDALKRCRDRNAHFADAYLAAAAIELKTPIASFDRDFDKFPDVSRAEL